MNCLPVETTESVPSIEPARFGDLQALSKIQDRSFRRGLAYRWRVLALLWLLPFVTFMVARDRSTGRPVGSLIADRERGAVRVINIAVDPTARRQGIGSALLRDLDTRLPRGNIVLMVEEPNLGAQKLYAREGFEQTGFKRNYYGTNRNGIEMTRVRETATSR